MTRRVTDSELTEPITDEEIETAIKDLFEQEESDDIWGSNTLRYYGPKTRSVLVTGEITEAVANAICSQIQELHLIDSDAPIQVHINTPGGSIIDALAIYDMLMCVSNPIITMVNGGCFSAGLIIACAGDHRLATPNSMYFYHQPSLSEIGINSIVKMESTKEFYDWCKNNTDAIMRERIGMDEDTWEDVFGHKDSVYFTTEEAIQHGFCTAGLGYMTKPTIVIEDEVEEEYEEEIQEEPCES